MNYKILETADTRRDLTNVLYQTIEALAVSFHIKDLFYHLSTDF